MAYLLTLHAANASIIASVKINHFYPTRIFIVNFIVSKWWVSFVIAAESYSRPNDFTGARTSLLHFLCCHNWYNPDFQPKASTHKLQTRYNVFPAASLTISPGACSDGTMAVNARQTWTSGTVSWTVVRQTPKVRRGIHKSAGMHWNRYNYVQARPLVCLANLHSQRLPKSFGISKVILERVSTLHYKSLEVMFPRGPVSPLSVCKS